MKSVFQLALITLFLLIHPASADERTCEDRTEVKEHMRTIYSEVDKVFLYGDKPEHLDDVIDSLEKVKSHLHTVYMKLPSKLAPMKPTDSLAQKIEFQKYVSDTMSVISEIELCILGPALPEVRKNQLAQLFMKLNQTVSVGHAKFRRHP